MENLVKKAKSGDSGAFASLIRMNTQSMFERSSGGNSFLLHTLDGKGGENISQYFCYLSCYLMCGGNGFPDAVLQGIFHADRSNIPQS